MFVLQGVHDARARRVFSLVTIARTAHIPIVVGAFVTCVGRITIGETGINAAWVRGLVVITIESKSSANWLECYLAVQCCPGLLVTTAQIDEFASAPESLPRRWFSK